MQRNRVIQVIAMSMTRRTKYWSFGLGLLLALFSMVAFASDYSNGLEAYLEGNYETAREYWLKAAQQKDAKSMFNLGLLHEEGRVDDADQDKAQRWYRSAGQNGYAAADYHLALYLLASDKSSEARTLLERSSRNGYGPAKKKLSEVSQRDGLLTSSVVKDVGPETTRSPSYRTQAWLKQRRATSWTIQMLAFNDEAKVQSFIDEHDLKGQAAYFVEDAGGEILYKLVYGVYESKDKADFARQNLSSELKQHGPWLRTIASVQAVINAQR